MGREGDRDTHRQIDQIGSSLFFLNRPEIEPFLWIPAFSKEA